MCYNNRMGKYTYDYDLILQTWREVGNQSKVAEILQMRQSQVSRILRSLGIHVGKGKRDPIHPLPMDEVSSRYLAGESCKDIASDYGIDPEVIRRRLRSAGTARRPRGQYEKSGSENPQWKGGFQAPMHYFRRQSYEVAAICLGQPLPFGTIIHHLDENPENNAPENLVLFAAQKHHASFHQMLLRLQREGNQVDASRLASENGGIALPKPPHPLQLLSYKDHRALRQTQE